MDKDIIELRLWMKQLETIEPDIRSYYIDNLRRWIKNIIYNIAEAKGMESELQEMLDKLDNM